MRPPRPAPGGAARALAGAWRCMAGLATLASGDRVVHIFDGALKAAQRDRAASTPAQPDPLQDEVAERLVERLEDCTRPFPRALVLGGAGPRVMSRLAGGRGGVRHVTYADTSQRMLDRAAAAAAAAAKSGAPWPEARYVRCDPVGEELPLGPGSVDVVISCLGLHWNNDVPGVMAQCRRALVPDGLFLAALLGGQTLQELRIACTVAQGEREGGLSPRVSPLVQVRDAGNLLTRAGLAIPAVDVDDIQVHYSDAAQLVSHLRRMAEASALVQRGRALRRDTALAGAAAYASLFGEPDGSVPATYQVVYMTGWSPDASQPKAARRGSATVSFQDLSQALGGGGQGAGGPGAHAGAS